MDNSENIKDVELEAEAEAIEKAEDESADEPVKADNSGTAGNTDENEPWLAEQKKHINRTAVIIGAAVALLVIIYVAGGLFFSKHILPNSVIRISDETGCVEVGFKTAEDIEGLINTGYEKNVRLLLSDDLDMNLSLAEIKDDEAITKYAEEIVTSQVSPWGWPVMIFKEKELNYDDSLLLSHEKLGGLVDSLDTDGYGTPSVDAYVTISENDEFCIMPAVWGTETDKEKLKSVSEEYLENVKVGSAQPEIDLTESGIYIAPEVTEDSEDLIKDLNELERIAGREITVDLKGASETVTFGDFIDKERLLETGKTELVEGKIWEYVSWLKGKYDTYETQRDFTTHDGWQIKVGGNGDRTADTYGFTMNEEGTAIALCQVLTDSEAETVSPVWDREGNGFFENGSDIGNTYIEISLAEQHLWYWVNGELFLETPVVTGLPTAKRSSPPGVYSIFSKGRNVTLRGEMDGERWESFVNYWMSITYTAVGIHDAPWRGAGPYGFGGNVYQYNGSHGCINLPLYAEETIYNNAGIGTCVVIY